MRWFGRDARQPQWRRGSSRSSLPAQFCNHLDMDSAIDDANVETHQLPAIAPDDIGCDSIIGQHPVRDCDEISSSERRQCCSISGSLRP